MARVRVRTDYDEEIERFEEWLNLTERESIADIEDENQLINKLERWLTSIDVFHSHAGAFARSMLTQMLRFKTFPKIKPKSIQIIKDFTVDRKGRRWLSSEERELARLWKNKKVTSGYVARELRRSESSIRSKARRLGVKRPKGALTLREVKKRAASKGR